MGVVFKNDITLLLDRHSLINFLKFKNNFACSGFSAVLLLPKITDLKKNP